MSITFFRRLIFTFCLILPIIGLSQLAAMEQDDTPIAPGQAKSISLALHTLGRDVKCEASAPIDDHLVVSLWNADKKFYDMKLSWKDSILYYHFYKIVEAPKLSCEKEALIFCNICDLLRKVKTEQLQQLDPILQTWIKKFQQLRYSEDPVTADKYVVAMIDGERVLMRGNKVFDETIEDYEIQIQISTDGENWQTVEEPRLNEKIIDALQRAKLHYFKKSGHFPGELCDLFIHYRRGLCSVCQGQSSEQAPLIIPNYYACNHRYHEECLHKNQATKRGGWECAYCASLKPIKDISEAGKLLVQSFSQKTDQDKTLYAHARAFIQDFIRHDKNGLTVASWATLEKYGCVDFIDRAFKQDDIWAFRYAGMGYKESPVYKKWINVNKDYADFIDMILRCGKLIPTVKLFEEACGYNEFFLCKKMLEHPNLAEQKSELELMLKDKCMRATLDALDQSDDDGWFDGVVDEYQLDINENVDGGLGSKTLPLAYAVRSGNLKGVKKLLSYAHLDVNALDHYVYHYPTHVIEIAFDRMKHPENIWGLGVLDTQKKRERAPDIFNEIFNDPRVDKTSIAPEEQPK